jgi:hypothetical protein
MYSRRAGAANENQILAVQFSGATGATSGRPAGE